MFKFDLDPSKKYSLSKSSTINLDFVYTQYPIRAYVKIYSDQSTLCPVGGHKPEGLWYAFGRGWLDWDKCESDKSRGTDETNINPLFEIDVNTDKFIKLSSTQDIETFHARHSVNGDETTINWLEVSKLYDGIEINPYNRELCDLYWYKTYDISSGCIWNLKAIKTITRLNKENI